ncbi:MAG: c-type cytochrome [Hydrogenophaga sp.]
MNKLVWVGALGAFFVSATAAQTACAVPDGGRLLASGCFQCHGTNGQNGTFNAIAGGGQLDMLNKLRDMRSKDPRGSIMNPHARGYTSEQLACITLYFSKQRKL